MAKKAKKQDPERTAERQLAKAQLKLQEAQEHHTQERVRGQQEVERARLRAAKWLAKAAQRVDQKAQVVAQAEGDLLKLRETNTGAGAKLSSPQAAAERLQKLETKAKSKRSSAVATSSSETSPNGAAPDEQQAIADTEGAGTT